MSGAVARLLPDGKRLHLQHGPIDLVIGVDGDRDAAFRAANRRFKTVLDELMCELPMLRAQMNRGSRKPVGAIAGRMDSAVRPHSGTFVTCMAAVAGSVADEILAAIVGSGDLDRAYVNNGGDIALHLGPGQTFNLAMATGDGQDLGRIKISQQDNIGGIATSGQGGRSLSFGIANSVTVLARTAAQADVAATLIANAVDLPGHPAIRRQPADEIQPDSDLADRPVVIECPLLAVSDAKAALGNGRSVAKKMRAAGQISSAALFLQGQSKIVGQMGFDAENEQKLVEYA